MDTLAIADAQRQIKALALQAATETIKDQPCRAIVCNLINQIVALTDATVDVYMAYKPIPGSRAIGGS
jgi:hypothetical protein